MSENGNVLSNYPPLSEDQRQAARLHARERVKRDLGDAPNRKSFAVTSGGQYPGALVALVTLAVLLVLGVTGFISATRVLRVALEDSLAAGFDANTSHAVSFGMFVMAELTLAVALLAARVLMTDKQARARAFMYAVAAMAAGIAVVSNAIVTTPYLNRADLWLSVKDTLYTFGPPLSTIAMVITSERLLLDAIGNRHKAQTEYEQARADWQTAQADPESVQAFHAHYRAALKDALRNVHKTRPGGLTALAALSTSDWQYMVARELVADAALDDIDALVQRMAAPPLEPVIDTEEATPEANPTPPPAPEPGRSMRLQPSMRQD